MRLIIKDVKIVREKVTFLYRVSEYETDRNSRF